MKIFKRSSLDWWQVGILKLALLSIGIAIGSYWADVFQPYIWWLVLLGVLLGVYMGYAWIKED